MIDRRRFTLATAAAAALVATQARSQEWLSKPIRMVLSQPPGSAPTPSRACLANTSARRGTSRW